MRVLIFGGPDYAQRETLFRALDSFHSRHCFTSAVNGGQVSRDGDNLYGADWLAAQWCRTRGIIVTYFCTDWYTAGENAGPLHNQRLLAEGRPQIAVKFPGGAGTADMQRRLIRADVPILLAEVSVDF